MVANKQKSGLGGGLKSLLGEDFPVFVAAQKTSLPILISTSLWPAHISPVVAWKWSA